MQGPKDHFDQLNMELLENSRREFELRLERERKEFDMKLFETSQEIEATNQKVATRFTVAMIVLTLVQIFLALDWGVIQGHATRLLLRVELSAWMP
jgi:hypothetical protein